MNKYEESQDDDRTYRHAEEHGVHGPQIHLREAGSRTSYQALQIIPTMQHRNKMTTIQANQICIIQQFSYFHFCFAIESLIGSIVISDFRTLRKLSADDGCST